ncbi:MAG: nitroreductase family protein [Bacteroidales bacterium]|jgi:nitroreductase
MKPFSELIKRRQSTRAYIDKPIEEEKILQCLEAARLAPSAYNQQPWNFVVVDEPDLKNRVAACTAGLGMNFFASQAPVLVVVVLDKEHVMSSLGGLVKDKNFCDYDVGMAVNQFCLQAAELDLDTCIMGWFKEEKIKKLLQVDKRRRIALMVALGYSEARIREKKRKPLEEMSSRNAYRKP